MSRFLYFTSILLLLFSCKNEEAETVDFNDIVKPSEKYGNSDTVKTEARAEPVYYDSVSAFSQQLSDSLAFDRKQLFKLDTLIYPDRFGAKQTDKWYYISPKDSLVFMRWQFKNRVQTQNTFFNWLDCYGPRCKTIAVGEAASFSKRSVLFLIRDKEMIFVESAQKMDGGKLLAIISNLEKQKQWQYFILQQPKGKAVWKTVDAEGAISDLKPENRAMAE